MSSIFVSRRSTVSVGVLGFLVGAIFVAPMSRADIDDTLACSYQSIGGATSGNDVLLGDDLHRDYISGLGGHDRIKGFRCGDSLDGNNGVDLVFGHRGNDDIDVGVDDDTVDHMDPDGPYGAGVGGMGYDIIDGNGGDDLLVDFDPEEIADIDNVFGGDGNDMINVNDGDTNDTGAGQGGTDDCYADASYEINCENETAAL